MTQIKLYAEYAPQHLLKFLNNVKAFSLDAAYRICAAHDPPLYEEMVLILRKMGKTRESLYLILTQLKDIEKAIEFVDSSCDDELWDELIFRSMQDPDCVAGLLEHAGGRIDNPGKLIRKIPNSMHIHGLRDKLRKIIGDYNLQLQLREGCNTILKEDCVLLMRRFFHEQRRGVKVALDRGGGHRRTNWRIRADGRVAESSDWAKH